VDPKGQNVQNPMSAGEMQSRNVPPEDSLAGGKRRVGEPETFEYDYDYTEVPDAEGTSRTRGAPPLPRRPLPCQKSTAKPSALFTKNVLLC
jgi:hypothetical protein